MTNMTFNLKHYIQEKNETLSKILLIVKIRFLTAKDFLIPFLLNAVFAIYVHRKVKRFNNISFFVLDDKYINQLIIAKEPNL